MAALLLATGFTSGCGQSSLRRGPISGVVDDWSTHHVKFANPGSEQDAIRKGRHEQWLRIVNDPRYRMQQIRRSAAWANRFAAPAVNFRDPRAPLRPGPIFGSTKKSLHRDWAYPVAPAGYGTAPGMYPAKYSFDVNAAPSCSDFVVYPVNATGGVGQPNLVGFNNLYDGLCPSSVGSGEPFAPSVQFAYEVLSKSFNGTFGTVVTSPVLSEDGTKLAFVANINGGVYFYVVTLPTAGNTYGSATFPTDLPANCNSCGSGAVYTVTAMSGSASDSISSPFVDYTDDIAYVGDDTGVLHKFTGVFNGTPAEVTSGGWPFTVFHGAYLTSPTLDSVTGHIFLSDIGDGNLYCIDISSGTPAFCSPIASVVVGTSVYDAPIVDSTAETVFASAGDYYDGSADYSALTQATTSLANVVHANMGPTGKIYNGDFDNTYYSSSAGAYSGYMYFCGTNSASFVPALYRVGFNSSGTMNSTNDGNSYPLANYASNCTPLTEVYNTAQNTDYMFLGVVLNGVPAGCEDAACVMSFELGSSFPTGPNATFPLGGNDDSYGSSGIIIDNVSTQTGMSQIYFGNLETGGAVQASQDGLN